MTSSIYTTYMKVKHYGWAVGPELSSRVSRGLGKYGFFPGFFEQICWSGALPYFCWSIIQKFQMVQCRIEWVMEFVRQGFYFGIKIVCTLHNANSCKPVKFFFGCNKSTPKVTRWDCCKQKSNNIVFEAKICKMQSGSKMWLDLDVRYLSGYFYSFP